MKAANEAKSAGDATPVIFDTLKAAQELRKTGFEDRQAEAVVETISKAVSETVATKADLQLLRSEVGTLRSDVELLRSEMAAQENRIVIKLGGLMITMIFVLLAIGPLYFRWVMSLMGSS